MIDKNTFGESPASIVLCDMLNQTGYNSRKIGRLFNNFDKVIIETSSVDLKIRMILVELYYNESLTKCDNFPTPLNTYSKNVLSGKYKTFVNKQIKQK